MRINMKAARQMETEWLYEDMKINKERKKQANTQRKLVLDKERKKNGR